jgi:hypothetical protein
MSSAGERSPLPVGLKQQNVDMSRWVAIVLPGGGYGPLGAALRFPILVLEAGGADTFVVDYPPGDQQRSPTLKELVQAANPQVARTITAAAADAERVTFVAKSFGTAILAHLDSTVLSSSLTEAIWLTPLFGYTAVRSGAIAHGWRSLLVAGDADDYHDPEAHETVRDALGADSLILKDADHRLEIPGNPIATVDSLRDLVEAVARFGGANPP